MTPYKRRVSYRSGAPHKSTPKIPQVLITWEPASQAYKCTFPYNKTFIDILKGTIPSSDRDYKPDTHTWYILEKYYDLFLTGAKTCYPMASFVCTTREEYEKNAASFSENAGVSNSIVYSNKDTLEKFRMLLLEGHVAFGNSMLTSPSLEEVSKAYKRAAFVFHPDRNPTNASKMSELNEVYTRLKGVLK